MPVIFVFPMDSEPITMNDLSETMQNALGFPCFALKDGKKLSAADLPDGGKLTDGSLWLQIPELDEEEEGQPLVHYEITPRLDREDDIQKMVDEIIAQDDSLKEAIEHNSFDIVLSFDETLASIESAHCVAYVMAAGTGGGLLVPGLEGDEETLWFSNADDFAEVVFMDETDEDYDDELGEEE